MRWNDHGTIGGDYAAARLREDHVEMLGVRIHAGFNHVLPVIGALTDELLIACHGAQQFDIAERNFKSR